MFDQLFSYIPQGVKHVILQGISDAHAELVRRVEGEPPPVEVNGRKRASVK